MINQNKENIKLNALKNTYEEKAWRFAISTADNDVARAISTNDRLTSAEIFDPFLDEIRKNIEMKMSIGSTSRMRKSKLGYQMKSWRITAIF